MRALQYLRLLIIFTLLMGTIPTASARQQYLRDVPSPFGCSTCHGDPREDRQGPNFRNGFGFDYVFQRQDWSQMCPLDSDGDGISNGMELLDPDCLWRPTPRGQPNTPLPEGEATHPGDPDDPNQCGDGQLQGSESCDGSAQDEQTCETLGYQDGQLGCTSICTFDESDCIDFPPVDMAILPPDMAIIADQHLPTDSALDAEAAQDVGAVVDEDAAPTTADATVLADSQIADSDIDVTIAMDGALQAADSHLPTASDARIPAHDVVERDAATMDADSSVTDTDFGETLAPKTSQGCHYANPLSPLGYCWIFLILLGVRRLPSNEA